MAELETQTIDLRAAEVPKAREVLPWTREINPVPTDTLPIDTSENVGIFNDEILALVLSDTRNILHSSTDDSMVRIALAAHIETVKNLLYPDIPNNLRLKRHILGKFLVDARYNVYGPLTEQAKMEIDGFNAQIEGLDTAFSAEDHDKMHLNAYIKFRAQLDNTQLKRFDEVMVAPEAARVVYGEYASVDRMTRIYRASQDDSILSLEDGTFAEIMSAPEHDVKELVASLAIDLTREMDDDVYAAHVERAA